MGDVTALCALPPQVLKLPSNSSDGARTQLTGGFRRTGHLTGGDRRKHTFV